MKFARGKAVIDVILVVVTGVTGPAVAIGVCLMLMTSTLYQDAPLLERVSLAVVAAGLCIQPIIFLSPEVFSNWWLAKDIGIQTLFFHLLWRAGRRT